jgi:uncharacterized protein (TIGR00369 family)
VELDFQALGEGRLPGHLGIRVDAVEAGRVTMHIDLADHHLAPNGYLHAGTVVTLADTACGYGCRHSLPEGGIGFTTIELKANFLGTVLAGTIACEATMVHGGHTTQVWDAVVTAADTGKTIAMFRCTQLVIYPR